VIDMAVAEFGRLDILVNSAAYRDAAPLSDGGGPG
jgi:NAD(P)-dependent dehydrogenase (short-subunit alcohol dehydrogenase family)